MCVWLLKGFRLHGSIFLFNSYRIQSWFCFHIWKMLKVYIQRLHTSSLNRVALYEKSCVQNDVVVRLYFFFANKLKSTQKS